MMTRRTHVLLAAAMLLLVRPGQAVAEQFTLDFERFPGPDARLNTADDLFPGPSIMRLTDQFTTLGVTFDQGSITQSDFFDGESGNHFITSTPPIVHLARLVFGVAIETNSFWDATLTAFDTSNAVLALATLSNPTAGISPVRGVLTVRSDLAIDHFSVLPPLPGEILNLDNLTFTTSSTVPEPSTLSLACVAGLVAAARRRQAKRHHLSV